jgi:predicted lipoprotein with Yx(FWY)xxD motif
MFVAGDGVTGVIGLATQADGSQQVTYDGRPLYYFKGDAAAGDVNGQGVGGVWFAATVDGSLSSTTP